MKKQELIAAFEQFRDSHSTITELWNAFDLNMKEAIAKYPFDKSFDELNIEEWCNDMLAELYCMTEYRKLATEHMNTGGGCMVQINSVYLPAEKRTVYVYCNEEGGSIYTVDFMQLDEYDDDMLIYSCNWESLEDTNKYTDLLQDCRIDYLQAEFRKYKNWSEMRYSELPPTLKAKISADHTEYLIESDDFIRTNGTDVEIPSLEGDDNIKSARNARRSLAKLMALMDTDSDKFADIVFKVTFGGQEFEFYNSAAIFTGLEDCMKYVIDQE